jgi:glucose uptake protein
MVNSMLNLHYITWLVLSSIFFAAGEFLSKKFALAPSLNYVFAILLAYSLGALAWLPAILQRNQLAIVGTMWSVLSLSTTIFIGIVIFGETLSATNIAGIGLGLIAVILLSI